MPTSMMPLTRERLLALLDDVLACPDTECLEQLRLGIAGAPAHDVHARMVRDLITLRARELVAPDTLQGHRQ